MLSVLFYRFFHFLKKIFENFAENTMLPLSLVGEREKQNLSYN